jgi:hypothetical protein
MGRDPVGSGRESTLPVSLPDPLVDQPLLEGHGAHEGGYGRGRGGVPCPSALEKPRAWEDVR